MEDCIFCQIVAGESPAYRVYEDESFLGFLDIYPHAVGHTLVVPKRHYQWVYEYPEFGKYWEAALTVTKAIQISLKPSFITYLTIGVDVPHAHIHIVPRFGKFEGIYPPIKHIAKEEMNDIAEKIRREIR